MKTFLMIITSAFLFLNAAPALDAANNCSFAVSGTSLILQGDCTTDASLVILNGGKLDLNGFTITALDPPGDHFKGGVVINGGPSAYVSNGAITAKQLADVCDAGGARLRGVLFDGASGAITNLRISNIN